MKVFKPLSNRMRRAELEQEFEEEHNRCILLSHELCELKKLNEKYEKILDEMRDENQQLKNKVDTLEKIIDRTVSLNRNSLHTVP